MRKGNLLAVVLNVIIAFAFCISCSQKSMKTERVQVSPKVLTDSLFIKNAASFICIGDYLVLQDPRQGSNFIKIYDTKGHLVSEVGQIGSGPEEFILPECIPFGKNKFLTWNRYGTFQTAVSSPDNQFRPEFKNFHVFNGKNQSIQLCENGNFIAYDPTKDQVITLYSPDGKEIASAGKLPFPSNIADREHFYSGKIVYNPENQTLLLYLEVLPYAATFKVTSSNISLLNERTFGNPEYTINGDQMQVKEGGKDCLVGCCLTEDFIISIMNDPDYTGNDNSQSSPKRHTVGVFDYDFNLVKIVNLRMPRYNLAASGEDNTFYAIVQNPENSIVEIEL